MAVRTFGAVVSIVLIGAVLTPIARSPDDDSFPLSTYAMFATPRPRSPTFHYALGETFHGERRILSPELIGTTEILQAGAMIELALAAGPQETQALCERIAARVAADPDRADIVAIRIVSGTHEALPYLTRDVIGREGERRRCRVERGADRP
jgi:hypothetical protein